MNLVMLGKQMKDLDTFGQRDNMGEVIDFQQYKEGKVIEQIEFITPKNESYCPHCQAPTLVQRTSGGSEIHTFDPNNMEAYEKVKTLLVRIVTYFKTTDQGVEDADLVEAFGEGMADFLKEMENENVKLETSS